MCLFWKCPQSGFALMDLLLLTSSSEQHTLEADRSRILNRCSALFPRPQLLHYLRRSDRALGTFAVSVCGPLRASMYAFLSFCRHQGVEWLSHGTLSPSDRRTISCLLFFPRFCSWSQMPSLFPIFLQSIIAYHTPPQPTSAHHSPP